MIPTIVTCLFPCSQPVQTLDGEAIEAREHLPRITDFYMLRISSRVFTLNHVSLQSLDEMSIKYILVSTALYAFLLALE
jgi:hypothetical protein